MSPDGPTSASTTSWAIAATCDATGGGDPPSRALRVVIPFHFCGRPPAATTIMVRVKASVGLCLYSKMVAASVDTLSAATSPGPFQAHR